MRKLIVLAVALLCSMPSFESFAHHPAPPPPAPAPAPVAASASPWLAVLMALPIVGFALCHYFDACKK